MVFTLHRYVFRELLKVFVLAVIALTLILSLGSILRPVQEFGVGPRQVIHLMSYFLPITLTFVLPMAALFSAALVYGRLSSDNEIDACRASGINMLTVIYPGLALALMVAVGNLVLSFHVMPYFVHLAEKSLKADAKQMLFRNIQRKGYYEVPPDGRYLIYADQVDLAKDTLSGVVVVKLKDGEIDEIIATEEARITFISHETTNQVHITAFNTYRIDAEGTVSLGLSSFAVEFGSLLGDDIKFKKIEQMKRIRTDPMLFRPVARVAGEIYAQLSTELLAQNISAGLADGPGAFYRLHSAEKFVDFTASTCLPRDEGKVELAGGVVVIESDAAGVRPSVTLKCEKAVLYIEGDELAPTLTMEIYNARAEGSDDPIMLRTIRGLIPPADMEEAAAGFKRQDGSLIPDKLTLPLTVLEKGPSSRLTWLQSRLVRRVRKTLAEIQAEINSRLVFGIGCVPMILIGIGLGIIKKGGHLLSAFGASCVPAAVLIVCIISGKHVTENLGAQSLSGTGLIWLGLALLSVLTAVIYRKLLKG
ncbi:MAG: LptF/LptG family permease [Phycisphaerales bacterium]|nr:MAG: LptF/LptG family permease [Phycisphaerales bacterium]